MMRGRQLNCTYIWLAKCTLVCNRCRKGGSFTQMSGITALWYQTRGCRDRHIAESDRYGDNQSAKGVYRLTHAFGQEQVTRDQEEVTEHARELGRGLPDARPRATSRSGATGLREILS